MRAIFGVCVALGLIFPSAALCTAAEGLASATVYEWHNWRGPEQNNTSRERGLVDSWDPRTGENLLWKSEELATRSTPIVMNGKLYTIVRHDPMLPTEGEKVVCADPATGRILWESRFNVYLTDVPGERVGWSNLAGDKETGFIYCQGVCGLFLCINGETGETVWKRPLHEEVGLLTTYGGRTNTPVVFEDLVIISGVVIGWGEMARPNHRFIAMDKRTGDIVWMNGTRPLPEDTTYSTPVVAVLGGQAALVGGTGDGGIYAFQPRTGKTIWSHRFSLRGLNVSPLIVGDTVYMGHSEENADQPSLMGAVVAINGTLTGDITAPGTLWKVNEVMVGKSSPIMVEGHLWTVDDRAKLAIFDPATGDQLGRRALGNAMRSTPLYADGKVYLCTNENRWFILAPDGQGGANVVHSLRLEPGEENHGSPIVAGGRIFLPTVERMYCIGRKDHVVRGDPIPPMPAERALAEDSKPAQLQIVPSELLLRPGQKQKLSLRAYNARGQRVSPEGIQVAFEVEGSGTCESDGTFTAAENAGHQAVYVRARSGDMSATARVRIVPAMPWKFGFDDGEIPITWVGARYRHIIRDQQGNRVMVKITTIPKGTRSMAFFGQADLNGYTIQADVLGKTENEKMPDIGLIAQGYIMDLRGEYQDVEIRSWGSQLRMARRTKFEWKPDVWYTMKFRAAVEDGRGVLRAKVWPKGEQEPQEWLLEATDPSPNHSGAPGLFGNATFAEILLDNISVTPND